MYIFIEKKTNNFKNKWDDNINYYKPVMGTNR